MSTDATPAAAATPPVVAKLSFLQQVELFLKKLLEPEAKAALGEVASYLTTNLDALATEASSSGMVAATFIESKVTSLISGNAVLASFLPFILPTLTSFLNTEIGYGAADIRTAITKVAAWLVAEEAVV